MNTNELNLTTEQWDHIREFVITIRVLARNDMYFLQVSNGARGLVISNIEKALANKANRMPVLRAITGINITSSKQLTAHYASTIIEEIIDGKNRETLQNIERFIESRIDFDPRDLFPWEKPTSDMSDM